MITDTIEALTDHFVDGWTNGVPAYFDNQPNAEPPLNAPWCRFSVRLGASRNFAGGASQGKLLRQGRVWLQIFTPLETSTGTAYALAEEFAELFRNQSIESIFLKTEEIQTNPDSDWFMVTVSVPFDAIQPN